MRKHDVAYSSSSPNEFSVGVFEWIPGAPGESMKMGPTKVRVTGSSECPNQVIEKANEIAAQLEAGTYSGPKTVTVT